MMDYTKYLPFLLALLLLGCKEESVPATDETRLLGKEYFHLEVGASATYQVSKVLHKELAEDEYYSYQLRQVVADVFEEDGYDLYRLELFVRANALDVWRLDSVWTIRDEGQRIVHVENNLPLLKAVLPLSEGAFWNGNVYNTLRAQDYVVEAMGKPYQAKGKAFDDALIIRQANSKSLINKDFRKEVYVKGKGLVHKYWEVYDYIDNSQNAFYGKDSVVGGIFYEQILIE